MNGAYSRYATPQALFSPTIERWLYTQESWQEIEQALAEETYQRHQPTGSTPGAPISPAQSAIASPVDQGKAWLDEADARQLARQIIQDGAAHGYRLATEVRPDQAVWLVRVTWEEHSLNIHSVEHWRSEFVEIHSMLQARQRIPG
ncbi:hypothetical protein [Dictyobacter kobayashii]|uniref:Uncharacterized protein n=1 Tax=Dictyobacter kobayashii TaxID=2014872 RepID=A0A402AYK0_9CHLR|nr:hypothetical protein [Dictyobacter kobayashii]GCE24189.1 hypothetical protein KDK_79890 [Dictyobacter kobayashii]